MFTHFVDTASQFHPTALAAPACVNLGLDDPDITTELTGSRDRLFYRKAGNTTRRCDAVLPQDLLALILVYVS